MGWLFGRKKEKEGLKVPFPKGIEEGALRLGKPASGKVIEPEKLLAAAGVGARPEEFAIPPEREIQKRESLRGIQSFQKEVPLKSSLKGAGEVFPPRRFVIQEYRPLFIKVDSYQRVLGELDGIKEQLTALGDVSRKLESSEYNEEKNFASLQRGTKAIHDHMLQIDTTIFKTRGE